MAAGDPHYRALGRMAHEFSLLESNVSSTIWLALGDMNARKFRAVTIEMSMRAKLELLKALVEIVEDNPARKPLWKEFFGDAEKVTTERNRLLHSPMLSDKPGEFTEEITTHQIARRSTRGNFEWHSYKVADIESVADKTKATLKKLLDLTWKASGLSASIG